MIFSLADGEHIHVYIQLIYSEQNAWFVSPLYEAWTKQTQECSVYKGLGGKNLFWSTCIYMPLIEK